ncbi:MAG: D-tyrosyl-tRNA(Tyr) deacylase [Firmicutes bacterium]|nr:D-tyrosyl-tRNA(Tyr) deacylase [Bacillota bacterium]MBQ9973298.1 D-tyrosyl-tRNA(Tyr) deacylase [Bacillota bacterium]
MRAVVQRVTDADVTVEGNITGKISKGFVVLIGVEDGDTDKDIDYIAKKVANLRVFEDEAGLMNVSLKDINGEILAISQFTLLGDGRKGNRPSFFTAAQPDIANDFYQKVIAKWRDEFELHVEEGVFQAEMLVRINNDGPVTILLDSRKLF